MDSLNDMTLAQLDPEIQAVLDAELGRQRDTLEMIASENFVPRAVLEAQGSVLTNKYAEGYPGRRYYGGCEFVDVAESLAIERAKRVFGGDYVNVQPHAGAQANAAALMAMANVGDPILGLSLAHGGHLTHGSPVNQSGLLYNIVPYGVDENGLIDYAALRALAKKEQPKMIIAGASAYPRAIDFEKFAEIAHEVGAYLFVDMAHIAGLVAAGLHQSPVPYADVVTTTTHKTLRGPRGGVILTNDEELAKKFNKAIFPGTQGGPLEHVIAAKAVCFGEALKPEFKAYQQRVVTNARVLADALQKQGFDLVGGGTDNHLMLIDLRKTGVTGKELQRRLDEVYITANKNAIPNDPESPFVTSGMRIGTPAVTTRGFGAPEMLRIAEFIWQAATDFDNKANDIRRNVRDICANFPIY